MNPQVNIDFLKVGGGGGNGAVVNRLMEHDFNVDALRPYQDVIDPRKGFIRSNMGSFITSNRLNPKTGKLEQCRIRINADTTLRKQEWIELDNAVQRVSRERLQLVSDIRSRGLVRTLANGLGKTVFESQRMTDPGSAQVNMEPGVPTQNDRPHFDLVGVPLPVVSSGFSLGARQLATSRNSGEALDTTMAEACTRRVTETVETFFTGSYGTFIYGGYTMAGIRNSTNRATYTITSPDYSTWTPLVCVNEVIAMRETLSVTHHHFGPYRVYVGPGWDAYLDRDYSTSGGNNPNQTLRDRVKKIRGIEEIVTLDHLSTYDMILVEMTTETIRAIVGLDTTIVQWETMGGMNVNFMVMSILVPQIRADKNSHTGIIHGAPV